MQGLTNTVRCAIVKLVRMMVSRRRHLGPGQAVTQGSVQDQGMQGPSKPLGDDMPHSADVDAPVLAPDLLMAPRPARWCDRVYRRGGC
jgi:hypothetical protein